MLQLTAINDSIEFQNEENPIPGSGLWYRGDVPDCRCRLWWKNKVRKENFYFYLHKDWTWNVLPCHFSWTEFQTMIVPQPVSGGGQWASPPSSSPPVTVHPCTLSVSGLARSKVAPKVNARPGTKETAWEQIEPAATQWYPGKLKLLWIQTIVSLIIHKL